MESRSTIELKTFEVTKKEQELMKTIARASCLLCCVVSELIYDMISTCENTNEMWDNLEVTYEGTAKVKKKLEFDTLIN